MRYETSKLGVELPHKKPEVLRSMDQRGISASKILGIFETENGNVDVSSAIIFKNYMREAATEICGK